MKMTHLGWKRMCSGLSGWRTSFPDLVRLPTPWYGRVDRAFEPIEQTDFQCIIFFSAVHIWKLSNKCMCVFQAYLLVG